MKGKTKVLKVVRFGEELNHIHDWEYLNLIKVGFTNPPKCSYSRICTECNREEIVETDYFIDR